MLSSHRWLLHANLVRHSLAPSRALRSSSSRGARISIVLTVIRITPWELQRKILICTRTLLPTPYLHSINFTLSGVAVFFFLQFAMLTVQVYWVCELSYAGWKHTPGSVCVLPEVVPISQVVSKSPPSLALLPVCSSTQYLAAVVSDAILVTAPLTVRQILPLFSLPFIISHDVFRSSEVSTSGRCVSAYFQFSPRQSQRHWRRWRTLSW